MSDPEVVPADGRRRGPDWPALAGALAAVLWAANGMNRPDGRRTAPTARNRQYIEIYLVGDAGAWRYDAAGFSPTGLEAE